MRVEILYTNKGHMLYTLKLLSLHSDSNLMFSDRAVPQTSPDNYVIPPTFGLIIAEALHTWSRVVLHAHVVLAWLSLIASYHDP